MSFLWTNLNLINFLTFYLLVMFAASTWRRWQQYGEMVRLVLASPLRWPHLLKLIKEHHTIFLTWRTVAPLALSLGLTLVQIFASQVLWPQADEGEHRLTLNRLFHEFVVLRILVVSLGIAMVTLDVFFLIRVGRIDRPMLDKYFDQAEYWLKSKMAHVVKIATLGWVNPRRMVADEVRKALVDASDVVNSALWWTNLQMALRFCFGLSLWIGWALNK